MKVHQDGLDLSSKSRKNVIYKLNFRAASIFFFPYWKLTVLLNFIIMKGIGGLKQFNNVHLKKHKRIILAN